MFSKRLFELRRKNGYTQEELGQKVGVGKTTISNYETGFRNPDNKILIELAKVFNVSIDYLLGLQAPGELLNVTDKLIPPTNILLYSGADPLKQEIFELTNNILNNVDDKNKLVQLKMFLETY